MDLIEKAKKQGLIFDGGFGSLLMQRGLPRGVIPEIWCLEHPEVVTQIHVDYIEAGADVITTNTFGASPIKLHKNNLKDRCAEINIRMVECAQKARKEGIFIAGDIGPSGEMLEPFGPLSFANAVSNFAEQAEHLLSAGVDFFIIETMFDLNEALAAIKGIQKVSTLPIFATLTFEKRGSDFATVMGNRIPESMNKLQEAGAIAVGANCSIGSEQMILLAEKIRNAVDCLVIIQPNAGIPKVEEGNLTYPESPEFFAENIAKIKSLGVEIVGGCCGTTPDYIKKIKELLIRSAKI